MWFDVIYQKRTVWLVSFEYVAYHLIAIWNTGLGEAGVHDA